jgi:competence protein ComFC
MKKIINYLFNLLFPTECISCGISGPDLCAQCIKDFGWPKPRKKNVRWITSLWTYRDGRVEKIMRHIKNMPNERAVEIIANLFAERILNRPTDSDQWIIIPIPISNKRFRERGYNQSLLLARPIAERLDIFLETTSLVKIRQTKKQGTSKSKEERLENVRGAFGVKFPERILRKKILLIDDITTTGSTLAEARKALLLAGATKVLALTVAN